MQIYIFTAARQPQPGSKNKGHNIITSSQKMVPQAAYQSVARHWKSMATGLGKTTKNRQRGKAKSGGAGKTAQ